MVCPCVVQVVGKMSAAVAIADCLEGGVVSKGPGLACTKWTYVVCTERPASGVATPGLWRWTKKEKQKGGGKKDHSEHQKHLTIAAGAVKGPTSIDRS